MLKINSDFVPGIQFLRGFAALAVVLCHYGSNLTDYKTLSSILNYGQYGIHVFFFISGYVICLSLIKNQYHPKYFFRFLLKRSIRIDPVYLITILLTLLSFWLFTFIPSFKGLPIPFVPEQFLAHILYVVPFTNFEFYNHIFWTLGVEFQFYVLIGALYFLSQHLYFRVSFLILFSLSSFITLEKSDYLVITYAPIFAMGIAIMHYHLTKRNEYLICSAFSAMLVFLNFNLPILLLLIAVTFFISYVKKISTYFNFLGEISYSLYIIHPLVLIYLIGLLKKLPIAPSLELLLLLVKVLIAIGSAYIFYILIERPPIRYSKKISYKKQ